MIRRCLLLVLLIICGLETRAQQVIWSQDFEYYYQYNFNSPWLVTGNSGFFTWGCDADYLLGGAAFPVTDNTSRVAGIAGNPIDSSVRLVTPPMNLSNVSAAFFKYKSFFKRDSVNGKRESAIIEASADGGATWTVLAHAPLAPGTHYVGAAINLTPFAGNAAVRVGFRYNDGGQSMTGWMLDDLVAYVPLQMDLALIEAQPADSMLAYGLQNDTVSITGKVFNNGVQPVTSFTINYKIGSGATVTQTLAGLSIQPLDTFAFSFAQPAIIPGTGRYPLKVWIASPNDLNPANDSAQLKIFGASFIPKKVTAVEEATGTWYPMAPQQHVFMDALPGTDYPANLISLHDADPMADSAYIKYIEHLRTAYLPFFYYDRRTLLIPPKFVTILNAQGAPVVFGVFDSITFFSTFDDYRQHFGFADISLQPHISNGVLTLNAGVKPAIDLHGDYRLALVITENKVQQNSAGYEQRNYYSGGSLGPMGGYEALPDPVPATSMVYNNVGRAILPTAAGNPGALPQNLLPGSTYNVSLSASLNSHWVQGHLRATVLLLNAADSTILNSASTPLPALAVNDAAGKKPRAMLYPNPVRGSANIIYELNAGAGVCITVEDMSGRIVRRLCPRLSISGVQQTVIQTEGLRAGLYVVVLHTNEGSATLKMTVLP